MASLLKVVSLENTSQIAQKRVLEPNLVMDSTQSESYRAQSEWGGAMDPVHLFHLCNISKIVAEGQKVVDLACGTADLLIKAALFFPKTKFIGVDLSTAMLDLARKKVEQLKLNNVEFLVQDITSLDKISDHSVDVVLSTMALHHLPSGEFLLKTGAEINRILKPDGGIYLSDFIRLKSEKSIDYLVASNKNQQDHIFQQDYRNSLQAAFSLEEIQHLAQIIHISPVKFKNTRLVSFMFTITTRSRGESSFHSFIKNVPVSKISLGSWFDFFKIWILFAFR